MLLVVSMQGIVPPAALLPLPFDGTPLWVIVYFLGAIGTKERLFVEGFRLDGKEILCAQISMKAPVCSR